MKTNIKKYGILMGLPPWIILGAVIILFPIFTFIALENVHRQKESSTRLLLEKGAALIRSFEAGTRAGIGLQWTNRQLERLLTETALQPDIEYLLVSDTNGTILAHNDAATIGSTHGDGLDLKAVAEADTVQGRLVEMPDGKKIFEVYRRFTPTGRGHAMWMQHGGMAGMMGRMRGRGMQPQNDQMTDQMSDQAQTPLAIFVGLDTTSIEAARQADTKHFLVMVLVLLLIGFAGIILLFMFQSYRATQASLFRIKAFSDTLVDNMPIGLVAIDIEKNIVSFNTVAESLLNFTNKRVIGENAEILLPKALWQQIEQLDQQGGLIEKEIDCTLESGELLPLSVSAAVLSGESGEFQGYVLLLKDLSEVKSLREEVERSERLATVGRLAAGVAHEIRNPLSSIKGFATYFKERYRDVAEDQQISGIMIQEVDRLNRVVSQLLEFARPVSISKKPISIKMFIENSLKLIEQQAADKNIAVLTHLPPDVEMVHLDLDKMSQVLLNLYLNAIEAMEPGGKLSIDLTDNKADNHIEIKISDTGTGIRETDIAHIFDPYFTTKAAGTGLGLAIAHKIVEGHGGEIHPESHPGEGTVFSITLPYGPE